MTSASTGAHQRGGPGACTSGPAGALCTEVRTLGRPRGGFFPVFAASLFAHPKFRGLTTSQVGAWLLCRAQYELFNAPVRLSDAEREWGADEIRVLIERRLLDVSEDGLTPHDVDENRAFPSDAPAMTRARKAASRVTNGHDLSRITRDSRARGLPWIGVSDVSTEEGPGRNPSEPLQEAIAYIEERTRRPWSFGVGSKPWETLTADVEAFGWAKVKTVMEGVKEPFPDVAQLVFGASRRLHPIPKGAPEDDSSERFDRGVQRTQRELAKMRGESV